MSNLDAKIRTYVMYINIISPLAKIYEYTFFKIVVKKNYISYFSFLDDIYFFKKQFNFEFFL